MMPQKKNPDALELLRSRKRHATALLAPLETLATVEETVVREQARRPSASRRLLLHPPPPLHTLHTHS